MTRSADLLPIQRATPGDLDAIRRLLDTCALPHEDLTPAHLNRFLVAQGENVLRGVVGLEPYGDAALLRSLAVAPAARGEGLGVRLVEALERHARGESIRGLYLLTTTAAEYFERHGYERIQRDALPPAIQQTEEAARLCPSTATCMRKRLGAVGRDEPDSA